MSDELEREPISRRDYLGVAGVGSATAAVAFSVIGMMRLPKPRVLPDVSSVVRLGKPSEFQPGTVAMFWLSPTGENILFSLLKEERIQYHGTLQGSMAETAMKLPKRLWSPGFFQKMSTTTYGIRHVSVFR